MKQWIRRVIALALAAAMFLVSQRLQEPEIVFPEILAVAWGALCMERPPWKVSRPWTILLMTAAAFAGVGAVRFLPLPLAVQDMAGFVFVAMCLLGSDTTMVPMISACILPMYLRTESLVYPIAVATMTAAVALLQWCMERAGLRPPAERFRWQPPSRYRLLAWGLVFAAFALLETAAVASGKVYLMVPPLIVTLAEGCFHDWTKKRLRLFLTVTCCALAGVLAQFLLVDWLEWPLAASGTVAAALVLGILIVWKTPFPPACAIGLLPFLLPREGLVWYPVLVATGCGVILLLTRLLYPAIARLLEMEKDTPKPRA